jgi:hypothetical protein
MNQDELDRKQKWLAARPCCRRAKEVRDKCVKFNGQEQCLEFVEAHQECLKQRRAMLPQ